MGCRIVTMPVQAGGSSFHFLNTFQHVQLKWYHNINKLLSPTETSDAPPMLCLHPVTAIGIVSALIIMSGQQLAHGQSRQYFHAHHKSRLSFVSTNRDGGSNSSSLPLSDRPRSAGPPLPSPAHSKRGFAG